ncbi:MAG: recombinase family protein [Pirellulaceae bacterium]|nr:recombinase family protein [Pirellulaceae bacterium]
MNVVIWARVSSREQREGYSIDAQLRANRERAERAGWKVVREFVVAESAKRGAERTAFNEMFSWVKANAKREKIKAILSHKLDRVCRNMRDAVRLQELEDACGVQLAFVENQFGPGAAGALSFNVMAAVAQYYSDNLRSEVLKGMDEKVRQGWPTGLAPFGYMNTSDREAPVRPHPEKANTVRHIFDLYSTGSHTFKSLADQLQQEGHTFRKSQPRFHRTALSYILKNRFYIGELRRNGQVFEGRYERLIERGTFDECQDVLCGRNRRTGKPRLAFAGGIFKCAYCGHAITGEVIRRKLRGGGVREHVYYRCANNDRGPDHPKLRWKAGDLERLIMDDLSKLQIPNADHIECLHASLLGSLDDVSAHQRHQSAILKKRSSELAGMQDRLLNAYLAGTVDEATYQTKSNELKGEAARVEEAMGGLGDLSPARRELAVAVFDWSQRATDFWQGSTDAAQRRILNAVYLNRTLSDVTLVTTKRKPFDALAERLTLVKSRGDWRSFEPLVVAYVDTVLSPSPEVVMATRVVRLSA